MSDYATDILRYTDNVNQAALSAIVKYCGIALQRADSSLVAVSDRKEIATIIQGFADRRLGLTPEAARSGIEAVSEKMRAEPRKSRVTFYYLLAETTGTLDKLAA